ncbi:acyl carrier protein [Pseudomonas sp. SDO528_S397]
MPNQASALASPVPLAHEPVPVAAEAPACVHTTALIRQAFNEVVGLTLKDDRQNFFDAGASSLKLVQLHVRLTQTGFPHLLVTDVFGYPNAHALAAHLRPSATPVEVPQADRHTRLEQRNTRRLRRTGGV